MKFLFQVLFIIIMAHLLEIFLPWYYVAVAAFIGGYVFKSKANFIGGFLAIAILWTGYAIMRSNTQQVVSSETFDHAERVAHVFTLPRKEYLMAVMAVIGGLVGGFASLSGSLLKRKTKQYY